MEIPIQVRNAMCWMVAALLGRVSVTWDEVEDIYFSGDYPAINANINYIITGEGSGVLERV